MILVSIPGKDTECLWENQVRSKLLKPPNWSLFTGFANAGIFGKWSDIVCWGHAQSLFNPVLRAHTIRFL